MNERNETVALPDPQGSGNSAYDADEVMAGLGYNDSAGVPTLLPQGLYPMEIQVTGYDSSSKAKTPGLALHAIVTDGPFAGVSMDDRASTIWLTPGGLHTEGRNIGKLRHMTRAVTGKHCDGKAAFPDFGFNFTRGGDSTTLQHEFRDQFAGLSPQQKLDFMAVFCRTKSWKGKIMVAVNLDAEQVERDGVKQLNADGTPEMRDRNSIANLFALNDDKHGLPVWKKVHVKQQQAAYEQMYGG
ncbi:MAG: hypothetical protein V3S43_06485 [Acidimicrobiia bacterium]